MNNRLVLPSGRHVDEREDQFADNPLICEHGSVADLMTTYFREESPLVEGFLYKGGCSQITGPGGVGKTTLAAGLVQSLRGGTSFLGLETNGPRPGERCRVGAMFLEGSAARHQARMKARGEVVDLWTDVSIRVPGFPASMPSFWDITDPQRHAQLIEWVEYDKLDVLILDPVNHHKNPALDENSASDMTVFIHALSDIRDATGAALVLVHHPPYGRKGGRGSTVLRSYLDAEIYLDPNGENSCGPGGRVKLSWTKPPRDGVQPAPIHLERGTDGMLSVADKRTADVAGELLRHRIAEAVGAGAQLASEVAMAISTNGVATSERNVQRAMKAMGDAGRLVPDPAWKSGQPLKYALPLARQRDTASATDVAVGSNP